LPREASLIWQSPANLQVAVIRVPNPLAGRNINAFIVLKDEFQGKRKEEEITE